MGPEPIVELGWNHPFKWPKIDEQRKVFGTSGNWRGVPTSFSSPVWFLKAWPRTPLPYRVWVPYFLLTGWVAGWPAGWLAGWAWLACWLAWLAGCWLAGCIYYMDGWYLMDVGSRFDEHESDLVLTSFWTSCWTSYNLHLLIGYINDEDKVPTSY